MEKQLLNQKMVMNNDWHNVPMFILAFYMFMTTNLFLLLYSFTSGLRLGLSTVIATNVMTHFVMRSVFPSYYQAKKTCLTFAVFDQEIKRILTFSHFEKKHLP